MKTLFFNPFKIYSEITLFLFGIITMFLGILLAVYFNARFDGVLDLHFVTKAAFFQVSSDLLIDSICLILILFLIGKYFNNKTRLIDIVSTSLIAKIPFYGLLFLNANNISNIISTKLLKTVLTKNMNIEPLSSLEFGFLFCSSIVIIIGIAWFIALLFNGFKTATNAKGNKSVLFFIGAIIISEIFSKILIATI